MAINDMSNQLDDLKEQEIKLLSNLSYVYLENKKYFIAAEEILDSLKFYLAPVVQHRDALDHIMRAYQECDKYKTREENEKLSIYKERVRQLDKALGHELRAFFDIADFICINIRFYIADKLKRVSLKKINKVWVDYKNIKQKVYEFSESIAKVRQYRGSSIESVNEYGEILDELLIIYKEFVLQIEPKLCKKCFFYKKKNQDTYYNIGG